MKEKYIADTEMLTLSVHLEGVVPRDFDTMDELMSEFSVFLRYVSSAIDRSDSLETDFNGELAILDAIEAVSNCLSENSLTLRRIIR